MSPRLTEAQITALRGSYTEYPERLALTTDLYPQPRRQRRLNLPQGAQAPAAGPDGLPTAPSAFAISTRLWSVYLTHNVANRYNQRGSPAFNGPALIDCFIGALDSYVGTPSEPFQINYSESPFSDIDSTDPTITLPGTPIGDVSAPFSTTQYTTRRNTGIFLEPGATVTTFRYPIGVYITLPRFYLGVAIAGTLASARELRGYFRIVEGAPPDAALTI